MKLIINIIFSIIIWGSIGYAMYKALMKPLNNTQALKIEKRKITCVHVGIAAFAFRMLIYIISVFIVSENGQLMTFSEFTNSWVVWDARHYIKIAEVGYGGYVEDGKYLMLVFFPLYSMLSRFVSFIIPNMEVAFMLTSCVAYSVGCGYMYELACCDMDEKTALNSVKWITIFPFAFFFGGIMTESVFFMTTAMTFYHIRKHNFLLAGIYGAFSALSRMIGIFIIVPAVVEWLDCYKPFSGGWKVFWKKVLIILPMAITVLGTLFYLYINYTVSGDAFKFMEYQQNHWNHNTCYFGKTIAAIFAYIFTSKPMLAVSIWIPSAVILILAAAVLIRSVLKNRNMYTVYLAGYIIINCSVTWLISAPRYMSAAIPMFLVIGEVTQKNKALNIILSVLSLILMVFYLQRYLFNMQVM